MERLLSLKASAGSGKTFSLAVRYLALLYKGARPAEILTVTFTNKSANEMRERIVHYLRRLEHEPDFLKALAQTSGLSTDTLLQKRGDLLKRVLKSDLYIMTIDAFLQKIARRFGHYAGVDPDFEVGPDDTQEVWERFLARLDPKRFEELVAFGRLYADPALAFELLYEKDKELPPPPPYPEGPYPLARYRKLQAQILPLLQTCSAKATELVQKDPEAFLTSKVIENALEKGTLFYPRSLFNKCKSDTLERLFFELIEAAGAHLRRKERYIRASVRDFYETYRDVKARLHQTRNRLDFKDIEHLVYHLLQEEGGIEREFLYFRLDTRIRHILIDEFQDTSITQWRIFEPLVEEIASRRDDFRSFFYVGDTKQAIYRFRGGHSRLFDEVYQSLKPFGMAQNSLRVNYRSLPEIVHFVNRLFDLDEKPNADTGGYVEVCLNPFLKHAGSVPRHDWQENLLGSLRTLLDAGADPGDIAILTFRNQTILELADFVHQNLGLTAVTTTRRQVIRQPKARAVIHLLKYLYHGEKAALFKADFLTFVGLPLDSAVDLSPHGRPARLIKEVLTRYRLWDEATLRLLEHAMTYDDLADFVHEIENYEEELPPKSVEGLNIMTVHKAKGLEFDHVIVLDAPLDDTPDNLIFDYEGLTLKEIRVKLPRLELADPTFKTTLQKERALIYQDARNREYVAYTRAKRSLFVLKNEKKSTFVALEAKGIGPMRRGALSPNRRPRPKPAPKPPQTRLRSFGKQNYRKESAYSPNDYEAIYLGLAAHALFEMGGNDYALNRYGAYCDYEKAKALYERANDHPPYRALLKGQVFREVPFVFTDARGEKRHGVIDLLIERENEVIIVDYKSAKPEDERPYIEQVRFYQTAMKAIKGKPARGYLFYLDTLTLKEVE